MGNYGNSRRTAVRNAPTPRGPVAWESCLTLCVAVTTADGLIMGADSMTVVRDGPLSKTYANANKVLEIAGLPIAVMTYGLGALGRRSIASLVDEWNVTRPGYEKRSYTVEEVGRDLGRFVFEHHRRHRRLIQAEAEASQARALVGGSAESEPEKPFEFKPMDYLTGLVIGGYQPGSVYPWLWRWEEPVEPGVDGSLEQTRPHEGEEGEHGPASGLDYWGDTRAVERLIYGHDRHLLADLEQTGALTRRDGLEEVVRLHRWDVVYEGMPIQDAADLARFVLQVGVGFEQFREGTPLIGGEIDIAVVTRSKVHWYERKQLARALAPQPSPRLDEGELKG